MQSICIDVDEAKSVGRCNGRRLWDVFLASGTSVNVIACVRRCRRASSDCVRFVSVCMFCMGGFNLFMLSRNVGRRYTLHVYRKLLCRVISIFRAVICCAVFCTHVECSA